MIYVGLSLISFFGFLHAVRSQFFEFSGFHSFFRSFRLDKRGEPPTMKSFNLRHLYVCVRASSETYYSKLCALCVCVCVLDAVFKLSTLDPGGRHCVK